jgi:hypothetical protein
MPQATGTLRYARARAPMIPAPITTIRIRPSERLRCEPHHIRCQKPANSRAVFRFHIPSPFTGIQKSLKPDSVALARLDAVLNAAAKNRCSFRHILRKQNKR